jgi:hypothetical protein
MTTRAAEMRAKTLVERVPRATLFEAAFELNKFNPLRYNLLSHINRMQVSNLSRPAFYPVKDIDSSQNLRENSVLLIYYHLALVLKQTDHAL